MLFDENMGFISYNLGNNKTITDNKLTTVDDGFNKGNMFQNLYVPYKNYEAKKVVGTTKKERQLFEIMSLTYAMIDLGLYLDLHPSDLEILKKYKSVVEESCKKEMEYVKEFGPLELVDNDEGNYFEWIKNPWPWTGEDAKYV